MSGRGLAILSCALATFALAQTYAMFFVFAYMTGWRRLARAYPRDPTRPLPPLASTRGVTIAAWGWNAPPLRLGCDACGMVLRPLVAFRPAFPTLVIPWDAIGGVERKPMFDGDVLVVRIGPGGFDRMTFASSVLDDRLLNFAGGGNLRESPIAMGENCP